MSHNLFVGPNAGGVPNGQVRAYPIAFPLMTPNQPMRSHGVPTQPVSGGFASGQRLMFTDRDWESLLTPDGKFQQPIQDMADLQRRWEIYTGRNNTTPDMVPQDIPATSAKRLQDVQDYKAAMWNLIGVIQANHSRAMKVLFEMPRYIDAEFEFTAFNLQMYTENAALGTTQCPPGSEAKFPAYKNYGSYEDRKNAIVALLEGDKSLVHSMLKNNFVSMRVAWNPSKTAERQNSNLNCNKRKAENKAMLDRILTQRAQDGHDSDQEFSQAQPPPRRRRAQANPSAAARRKRARRDSQLPLNNGHEKHIAERLVQSMIAPGPSAPPFPSRLSNLDTRPQAPVPGYQGMQIPRVSQPYHGATHAMHNNGLYEPQHFGNESRHGGNDLFGQSNLFNDIEIDWDDVLAQWSPDGGAQDGQPHVVGQQSVINGMPYDGYALQEQQNPIDDVPLMPGQDSPWSRRQRPHDMAFQAYSHSFQ
ncbi:hypothetical protein F5Y18DRAFT_432058 [Xylariaceae sp. FL1019]|nr:hypothetical protein F5Y18DRAFT_432058 [Xylariaceae sp. FL1019]